MTFPISGGAGLLPPDPAPAAPATVPTPAYHVTFYERDAPHKRQTALLGETPPTPAPTSAGSDWEVVTLPKRSAVTIWRGRFSLITMDVPVILGNAGGGPVHPFASVIAQMWRPANPTVLPPVVKITSPGDAVPHQNLEWVVNNLTASDAVGGRVGNRVMQKLTVTLLEFREDEVLQQVKAAKPKHRAITYTVRSGDTLSALAKRFKVKGGWRAIANAQHPPIHDPRKLRIGQRLLIP